MDRINVLICDDSALMRRSLTKIIESDRSLRVIGTARDGEDAVAKARELRPDVITMDINMPGMDGITALQIIMSEEIAPVLMISSLTSEGAEITFEALALGAFDYVFKPGGTVSTHMGTEASAIIEKIKMAGRKDVIHRLSRKSKVSEQFVPGRTRLKSPTRPTVQPEQGKGQIDFMAVAIGISTGGPKTLFEVLPLLPENLNAAVFIVQHMPPQFTHSFAQRICDNSQMPCVEAKAGLIVERGMMYLAKGGNHLTLHGKSDGQIVIRTPTKPEMTFIPSVDTMMDSVLNVFGSKTVGVLMTGMGSDGADAMVNITKRGCVTIAESQETAIVFGMPQEAIKRGGAKIIAPSWGIAKEIIKAVR